MDIAERAARDINLILTLDERCKQQAAEIERLRKRDEFISILDRQIAEKDAEIERLRQVVENWRELVGAKVLEEDFHRILREDNERLRHALHMIATHPEIHLGAAEEMAAIAERALQQKDSE